MSEATDTAELALVTSTIEEILANGQAYEKGEEYSETRATLDKLFARKDQLQARIDQYNSTYAMRTTVRRTGRWSTT